MDSTLLGLILDSSVIIRSRAASAAHERAARFHPHHRRRLTDVLLSAIKVSGEQAAKGIRLPFDDLAIGASALEQGYGVATLNARHFEMIPDLIVKRF